MLKMIKILKHCSILFILSIIITFFQCFIDLIIPLMMANVIDFGILNNNIILIYKNSLYIFILGLFSLLISFLSSYLYTITSTKVSFTIRKNLFSIISSFSITKYQNFGITALINRIINDTSQIQQFFFKLLSIIIPSFIYFLFGLLLIIYINNNILIYFFYVIPLMIFLFYSISKRSSSFFQKTQKILDNISLLIREYILGIKIIRSFNLENILLKKIIHLNNLYSSIIIKASCLIFSLMPITTIIVNIFSILIFWFFSFSVVFSKLKIGMLLALIQYISISLSSIISILDIIKIWPKTKVSIIRLYDIIFSKSEKRVFIENFKSFSFLESDDWTIKFKNVTFLYPNTKKKILNNISFTINKKETTAIIGSTGSGKSTIFNLLLKFYNSLDGEISINGVNIRNIDDNFLRQNISWVPQQLILFSGTIKKNILYGNQHADLKKLLEVVNISQSSSFIEKYNEKMEYILEKNGKNLSGGQKQRISIARSLMRDAKLYLFDDITSSLDSITASKLIKLLKSKLKDKTVLFISQKINVVKNADKIIVLNNGKIIDIGTHNELLKRCSYYFQIVSSQSNKNKDYQKNIIDNYKLKNNNILKKNISDQKLKSSYKKKRSVLSQFIYFFKIIMVLFKKVHFRVFYFIILIFNSIFISFCNIIIPYLFGIIINSVSFFVIKQNINFELLFFNFLLILLFYILNPVIIYIQEYFTINISQRISRHFQVSIEKKLSKLSISYFDNNQIGYILNLIHNDIELIYFSLQKIFSQLLTVFITLIGTFFVMFYINIYMSILFFFFIPTIFLILNPLFNKSKIYFKDQQKIIDTINSFIEEYLSGYIIIKSFNLNNNYIHLFNKINILLYKKSKKYFFLSNIIFPILFFINTINYVVFCIIGSYFILNNILSLGEVHVYITYSKHLSYPLLQISNILSTLQSMIGSIERILYFLKLKEEKNNKSLIRINNIKGKIEFRNITFGYSKENIIINDLNFIIPEGKTVAIVGSTGSGKSTILNLLLQFYDVNSGDILIDDINIKEINKKQLRKIFSVVLQDNFLFSGTIKENICYGKKDINEVDFQRVINIVGLSDYIDSLPLKENTIINENLSNISYSQRQQIAISRALLTNRAILILDEATSNIDSILEKKLQKSFKLFMKGKTTIIIAHKLSTIFNSDIIFVLDNGKIIEKGTHNELMKNKGYYYNLVKSYQ